MDQETKKKIEELIKKFSSQLNIIINESLGSNSKVTVSIDSIQTNVDEAQTKSSYDLHSFTGVFGCRNPKIMSDGTIKCS